MLVLAGTVGCGSKPSTQSAPATPEEKAYLAQIQITGAHMSAAQNFLGQTVITLEARVTNKGDKTVRSLELGLAFLTFNGQVDLRTKVTPIGPRTPLKPHESRPFKVSFDRVPEDWDQAPPEIKPLRVLLAGQR